MATERDVEALLELWNQDTLGRYEGKWIAFTAEARDVAELPSSEHLRELLQRFPAAERPEQRPLIAYVTFMPSA